MSGYLSPANGAHSPSKSARSSPAARSKPATHPLNMAAVSATSSASLYGLEQGSTSSSSSIHPHSRPVSPSSSTIRPRKVAGTNAASMSSSSLFDATYSRPQSNNSVGVTRPQLERLVSVAERTSFEGLRDTKGKGKASLSDLPSARSKEEKTVIVHQVQNTDTMASICLAYGISAHALRSANRMWPSDSIHLRKTLLVPIEHCHLPSVAAKKASSAVSSPLNTPYPENDIIAPAARRQQVDLWALEQHDASSPSLLPSAGSEHEFDPWPSGHDRWRSASSSSSVDRAGSTTFGTTSPDMSSQRASPRAIPPPAASSSSTTLSSPDPFGLTNLPPIVNEDDTFGANNGGVEIKRVPTQALSFFPSSTDEHYGSSSRYTSNGRGPLQRNGSPAGNRFNKEKDSDLGFSLLGPLANMSIKALTNARKWQWTNYGAEAEGYDVPTQGVSLNELDRRWDPGRTKGKSRLQ